MYLTISRKAKNSGTSRPCSFEIRDSTALDDFARVMLLKIELK